MNRRTSQEIEKMNQLFREIGAGEEIAIASLREARLACNGQQEYAQCRFSEACQKVIYPSEAYAEKVATSRRRKGAGKLRAYRCDPCHGFHLTSYIPHKP